MSGAPKIGQIWLDVDFFGDGTKKKYFLVLALTKDGDVVHRNLTKQGKGRGDNPRCHHGAPFDGFYLGVLGGPLTLPTWLDLGDWDDLDDLTFAKWSKSGKIKYVMELAKPDLCLALRCAAGAVSGRQRLRVMESVGALSCP